MRLCKSFSIDKNKLHFNQVTFLCHSLLPQTRLNPFPLTPQSILINHSTLTTHYHHHHYYHHLYIHSLTPAVISPVCVCVRAHQSATQS